MSMNLWTENEEDLREETREQSTSVNKSGVYNCTIEEALIISGKNGSQSKGLKLVLKTDEEQYFYPVEFFIKADGTENEYARKKLNKLTYLCKLKNKDLVPIETPNKVFIPALADKKIGVIVEVSLNGNLKMLLLLKDQIIIILKKKQKKRTRIYLKNFRSNGGKL